MTDKDVSPAYRIKSQDENSIRIEYQTECEKCGSLVDYYHGMQLVWRERPILYHDEGCFCSNCWRAVEGEWTGISSREVSKYFEIIEGVWFLTMKLPNQDVRNELIALLDVEFADNRLPFEFFQATPVDFIVRGARLELRYFQQVLGMKSIESHLQSKQDWLAEQKHVNDE